MPSLRSAFLLSAGLAVLVTMVACSRPQATPAVARETTLYVNADLGFAIEHPQDWRHGEQTQPAGCTGKLRWASTKKTAAASLEVTVLAPPQPGDGLDQILQKFVATYTDFTVTEHQPLQLAGVSAEKIDGHTADRTFEVIAVAATNRTYLLALAAPSAGFAAHQELFDKIVDSFRILP